MKNRSLINNHLLIIFSMDWFCWENLQENLWFCYDFVIISKFPVTKPIKWEMMNEIAIDYYLIGGSNPSQEYDWISSSHLWLNIANIIYLKPPKQFWNVDWYLNYLYIILWYGKTMEHVLKLSMCLLIGKTFDNFCWKTDVRPSYLLGTWILTSPSGTQGSWCWQVMNHPFVRCDHHPAKDAKQKVRNWNHQWNKTETCQHSPIRTKLSVHVSSYTPNMSHVPGGNLRW
jgi:hypothetical protein